MEKITLFLVLTIFSCGSIQQSGMDSKIKQAYRDVSKKYNGNIVVSDTIVNIDIINFFDKISSAKGESGTKILDSLVRINEKNKYEEFNYPIKKILKNQNNIGDVKFFFSKPTSNHIMVEVFKIKSNNNKNYEELTLFGSSDVYLFKFEDNKIIDKYQIKLDYN